MLVLRDDRIEHKTFRDFPSLLNPGDLLVLNETRVIAARIFGHRVPTGGAVELLLLHPASSERYDPNATRWLALSKPARRLHIGDRIDFGDLGEASIVAIQDGGLREIELALQVDFETFLDRAGRLPLPPYVRADSHEAQAGYQTIFAREPGSVAAPTASLHFTLAIFEQLARRGVQTTKLVLDVGLGTFRPLQTELLAGHRMHGERFAIPVEAVEAIRQAKSAGGRIVAAGTTVVRALEAAALKAGGIASGEDRTDLFIKPGFRFQVVDALLTNFHLPRSTLLVLVSAFAGHQQVMRAYREAVEQRYRFFSFGDAMFIEPVLERTA